MDIAALTIAEIQEGIRNKSFSARELASASVERIRATDENLGAFLRLRPEAMEEADEVDKAIATGKNLPLAGVPIAIKDNMVMRGELTTAASKILANYKGVYTATAVAKLQAAGAIVIGKTNLDEFAMGASTENSAMQPTKNPWDTSRVPGGSSGGSAVAVAAGQVVAALGSDTGGSIRQPAAFCNLVGFKPTYGRVSRYGLMALASSLDQIGPFTRNVADAAAIYQAIAGHDDCDATSSQQEIGDLNVGTDLTDVKIGLPKEFFGEGVDPSVAAVVEQAAKKYEELGAKLVEVSLPHAPQALATYYVILPAEASSNLARYDGIRYGLSIRDGHGLKDIYQHTSAAGFGPEVKRRIIIGTFSLSAGYADAYYHQANRVRAVLREEFHQVFDQVDLLLTPTSPTPPFKLGDRSQDPLQMYLADLLTVPANLADIPAMSLPAGFADNLPVGLQLMSRKWNEGMLFRAAGAYQAATDWHTKQPKI